MNLFNWFKPKQDLSLKRMKELHREIIRLHDVPGISADCELTEVLRELAEIMIHGEKESDSYFEFFLEENMLQDIISIIKQNRSNKIKIQIIQTISILIQNIKNRTSLFFILSNNHINDLITTPLDFMDEDVVSQYISFLKLLSMNLTADTVQFFYNYTKSADPFPLFSICSKFYDNPEPMVRIAVRTITLNCLKVNDKNIVSYMSQPNSLKYFKKLVYYVISLVVTMDKMVEKNNFARVGELTNNIIDQLFFLQDVLNIQVAVVEEYLKTLLMSDFFVKYCFNVIQNASKHLESFPDAIQLRTSLFLLSCVINTMKDPDLQKHILSLFFPERDHLNDSYLLPDSPLPPISVERRMSISHINLSPTETNEGGESIALITVLSSPVPTEGSEDGNGDNGEDDSVERTVENTEVCTVENGAENVVSAVQNVVDCAPDNNAVGSVDNTPDNTPDNPPDNTAVGSVDSTQDIAIEPLSSQEGPKTHLAPVSSTDVQEMPADEDTLIVMDSDDSDEVDTTTAATLNDLALHSLQRRARLLSANTQDTTTPSHTRNCLSEDLTLSSPTPHSPLESTFKYCPILQLLHEGDDAIRLQLVLVLLSAFHQSVYSGITAYAQQQAQGLHSVSPTEDELIERDSQTISGFFLCNQRYGQPVLDALCEVLRGPHLRPVTAQCCLYVLRYLLTNHIYGDTLPFETVQTLADIMRERATMVLNTLHLLRPLLQSSDDLIYSFLSTCSQVEYITGSSQAGFMMNFDFKGILESTSSLLPLDRVTNTPSISVPGLYKWTDASAENVQQSIQAFVMQLTEYLLLRTFIFFLLRKRYVEVPPQLLMDPGSPLAVAGSPEVDSGTVMSPRPISVSPGTTSEVMSVESAIAICHVLGVAVDETGIDLELQKTINQPSISVNQKVEISRVNRYLPCTILPPATTDSKQGQTVYLAIGRSQLSLLSMVKGSLKDAMVQFVFSLYELLDICIEDNTRRTVSILIQTDKVLTNCEKLVGYTLQNRPGKSVYKLLLQFTTAPACVEAQRCIMVARNKDMEKRNRDIEALLSNNANSHVTKVEAMVSSVNE